MVAAMGGWRGAASWCAERAVLERAAKTDVLVFDKTGTITEGQVQISQVLAAGVSPDELLSLAASAEHASSTRWHGPL